MSLKGKLTGPRRDEARTRIPLTECQVWDAVQTNLPGSAATDDLAVISGTFLTDTPVIQSSDAGATTVTQKARFQFQLPSNYKDGDPLSFEIDAGMITTVSDDTATLDLQVVNTKDPDADIIDTAAQSINSLTSAVKTFYLTAAGRAALNAGELLDCVVTIAITDAATTPAVLGQINSIDVVFDSK